MQFLRKALVMSLTIMAIVLLTGVGQQFVSTSEAAPAATDTPRATITATYPGATPDANGVIPTPTAIRGGGSTATPPGTPHPGQWCMGSACPTDSPPPPWGGGIGSGGGPNLTETPVAPVNPTPSATAARNIKRAAVQTEERTTVPGRASLVVQTSLSEGSEVHLTSAGGQVFATLRVGPDGNQHDHYLLPGLYYVHIPGRKDTIFDLQVASLQVKLYAGEETILDLR